VLAPAIATLLDALVGHLSAAEAQTALGGTIAVRRGYQESQPLADQASPTIWLSPGTWRPLGRAGGLSLEEQIVDLEICRRSVGEGNTQLDEDVAIAEQVRELLEEWHDDAGRIVDIAGPLTIDRGKLTAPGQSRIGLQLNCDLLRGAAAPNDPTSPGRLNVGRDAVWAAIAAWEPLEDAFARKYESSADIAELQLRDPAAHELPAIALTWDAIKPEWRANRDQEWPMAIRATIWLPGDQHARAECLAQDVCDAIYRAKLDGESVTAIQHALKYPPRRVSDLTIQSAILGRTQLLHAIRVDIAFTLRSTFDPFGAP
jgi:hypothetical protein